MEISIDWLVVEVVGVERSLVLTVTSTTTYIHTYIQTGGAAASTTCVEIIKSFIKMPNLHAVFCFQTW